MPYPDVKIVPYDQLLCPGKGRDVIERVCFGCHTAQLYPYNVVREYPGGRPSHDWDGWSITVSRQPVRHRGPAFNTPGKPSAFDGKLISPQDEKALVDYLSANFGPDSVPRAVKMETQPRLDKAALAKAQFIEYRFLNKAGENRFTHTLDFDPTNGHVFAMDRGAASIVDVDPQTGGRTDHIGQGGGEYLQVDVDGTIWYGGLGHLDPKTGLFDTYKLAPNKFIGVSSMVFNSKGDLWLSLLGSGGLAKWDRATDKVSWWDVPILRSRPYGITVDRDKVSLRRIPQQRDRSFRSEDPGIPPLSDHQGSADEHSPHQRGFTQLHVGRDLGASEPQDRRRFLGDRIVAFPGLRIENDRDIGEPEPVHHDPP